MCALQDGQIVDVAAPETRCLRLHSKHSMTELDCRFQKSSSLPKIDEEVSGAGASCGVRSFRPGLGTNGVKERPHWRQIELLAAAYSVCLKPQCGHSALTFAGDGLATVCLPKPFLRSHSERRLDRLAGPHNFRARCGLCRNGSGGDFGFPDKSCPFFNHKTRCFEISLQHAFGFKLAA